MLTIAEAISDGLGASDEATIRSILGTGARETRLRVELDEWKPPLPQP